MNDPKTIAIIDDGVNPLFFNIWPLESDMEVTEDLRIRKASKHSPYTLSHGTFCAAIIRKFLPLAKICSIKVLDKNHKGTLEQTETALEWCMKKHIELINMSIGTISPDDFCSISKMVDRLYEKQIIIVAASNNNNRTTYPACLEKVIGVRCCTDTIIQERDYYYHKYNSDGIDFTCNGVHDFTGSNEEIYRIGPSNSFAAPLITTIVYEILQNNSGVPLDVIRDKLIQGGVALMGDNRSNYERR